MAGDDWRRLLEQILADALPGDCDLAAAKKALDGIIGYANRRGVDKVEALHFRVRNRLERDLVLGPIVAHPLLSGLLRGGFWEFGGGNRRCRQLSLPLPIAELAAIPASPWVAIWLQ